MEHDGFAPLQPVLLDCVFHVLPGPHRGEVREVLSPSISQLHVIRRFTGLRRCRMDGATIRPGYLGCCSACGISGTPRTCTGCFWRVPYAPCSGATAGLYQDVRLSCPCGMMEEHGAMRYPMLVLCYHRFLAFLRILLIQEPKISCHSFNELCVVFLRCIIAAWNHQRRALQCMGLPE